ncbi:MAG: cytochrome c [Proteobacteria bacterium]|nr:cytochrome c [Pseudomonadota bacterium]
MKISILTVATVLVLGLGAQAQAVDEPENVIKYRQSVMKAIGGHTGAIVGVVKGEVSYVDHVAAHARGINEMSKLLAGLFPEGTSQFEFPNTRALPEIWDDFSKFEAAAKALEVESAKMVEVAASGDLGAIGGQLQNLGKACGSCHKSFRQKK